MRNRVLVTINNFKQIKEFAKDIMSFKSDIDVYRGMHCFDAKSILGVVAFDMSQPTWVEIYSDDEEEIKLFIDKMNKYTQED